MTHQLNFIYNDSDWVCPQEYPDLSQAKEIAIDLARVVLPRPGTSSIKRCPLAKRHTKPNSIAESLPMTTLLTLSESLLAISEASDNRSN